MWIDLQEAVIREWCLFADAKGKFENMAIPALELTATIKEALDQKCMEYSSRIS